eukprot:scaffold268417_cov17-Tisochrysis_lutea.AAC.2
MGLAHTQNLSSLLYPKSPSLCQLPQSSLPRFATSPDFQQQCSHVAVDGTIRFRQDHPPRCACRAEECWRVGGHSALWRPGVLFFPPCKLSQPALDAAASDLLRSCCSCDAAFCCVGSY